ncbi:MAG: hypothetical protein ACK4UO_16810 [Pseudolabrys sp.]
MDRKKETAMLTIAPNSKVFPAPNMAAVTDKLGLSTTPAAWPSSVSRLALAIDACQGYDTTETCHDSMVRAPKAIKTLPAFRPNAAEFARNKADKERG